MSSWNRSIVNIFLCHVFWLQPHVKLVLILSISWRECVCHILSCFTQRIDLVWSWSTVQKNSLEYRLLFFNILRCIWFAWYTVHGIPYMAYCTWACNDATLFSEQNIQQRGKIIAQDIFKFIFSPNCNEKKKKSNLHLPWG